MRPPTLLLPHLLRFRMQISSFPADDDDDSRPPPLVHPSTQDETHRYASERWEEEALKLKWKINEFPSIVACLQVQR